MLLDRFTPNKPVFVYTTCGGRDEARNISLAAINEHLAVCADFWPAESIYPWQGVIENVEQYIVLFTTDNSLSGKLINFIVGIHSYSVPMVVACDITEMSPAYKFWMKKTFDDHESYTQRPDPVGDEDYHPDKLK